MALTSSLAMRISLQTAFLMIFGKYQVAWTTAHLVMMITQVSMDSHRMNLQRASMTRDGCVADVKRLPNFDQASMQATFSNRLSKCWHLTTQRMNCKCL